MSMHCLRDSEILKLNEIDSKLNELYELKNKYVKKLVAKYGACEGYTKVEGEKPFLRVKITDVVERLKNGETVYRNTGFNQYHAEISFLKNEPKS